MNAIAQQFADIGEYVGAALFAEPERSLFYRKALGLRRLYENCDLPEYTGKPLYPSGKIAYGSHFFPNNNRGLSVDLNRLRDVCPEGAEAYEREFFAFTSSLPPEHVVGGNMYTHTIPNYHRILVEGLDAYLPRIEKIADRDMREGLLHLVAGIRAFAARCADRLAQSGAPERLVSALRRVPMQPARDVFEAAECWNFVMYLDRCDNLGCLEKGLLPYWKGEDIVPLLENLYENLDVNVGWSMALHPPYSPLTLQCLRAAKGHRRPMIELFVDENTPEEVWETAFDTVRSGSGQPAFYNPHVLLRGLKERFPVIREEDIPFFCGGGCTEAMFDGCSNVGSHDAGINLLLILENTLKTKLTSVADFESFYAAFMADTAEVTDTVTREIANSQERRAKLNPVPMRTLLVDDCIDREIEYNAGGARYSWSQISFAGLINVIDGLLTVRELVFRQKKYTAAEVLEKLSANDADFLRECRLLPVSYGHGSAEADAFAHRLSADVFALLDGKKPWMGEGFLASSVLFSAAAQGGADIGATPDGRAAGAPLADSVAPILGKDTAGPTAMLKSVTSLDIPHALGVPVLNFNIEPTFRNDILKSLILSYMEMKGIHFQISCVSREMLEEAYKNPDLHRNLIVRVGGYSEYFCNLTDELKRAVIARTIQKGV